MKRYMATWFTMQVPIVGKKKTCVYYRHLCPQQQHWWKYGSIQTHKQTYSVFTNCTIKNTILEHVSFPHEAHTLPHCNTLNCCYMATKYTQDTAGLLWDMWKASIIAMYVNSLIIKFMMGYMISCQCLVPVVTCMSSHIPLSLTQC